MDDLLDIYAQNFQLIYNIHVGSTTDLLPVRSASLRRIWQQADCPRNRLRLRDPHTSDGRSNSLRRISWRVGNKTRASRSDSWRTQAERDVDLALADWKFDGASGIVEGVGRHWVVVCVASAARQLLVMYPALAG